ncbi:hypothetical protein [uncultured Maritimibacter sp.]|jgi:hypothetical protein|uniref:hypothetical protein n=1 Tax=uncultured Maritimibacter sp. TaxID=991866 RepID=UPI000A4444C4|nr:hypothetical protein [uncultured Maritimibacter sp.]
MKIDMTDPDELPSLVTGFLGVLSFLVCGMAFVYAIGELPHFVRCCGDAGETYSSPSVLMMIISTVLFPLTILLGFVLILFDGQVLHFLVMLGIIGAWVWATFWRMGLKDRKQAAMAERLSSK